MKTLYDMRRNAFDHYHARAENARACAWVLANAGESVSLQTVPGYSGSTSIAWYEGFLREASLAIELLLKAAICLRIEAGARPPSVPMIHDIPKLWLDAGLKRSPDAKVRHHLERFRVALEWSGCYPVASNATKEASDGEALLVDAERRQSGKLTVYRSSPVDWCSFELVWTHAQQHVETLLAASPHRF